MRAGGEIVYVAVGANLGDREAAFAGVIEAIEAEAGLLLLAASAVFETAPVGPAGQGAYLNAALEMRTWLSPLELLRRLQKIELRLGRDRGPEVARWGPRVIDLDVLFYGERCIDVPDLVVPHPRAHQRAFVMLPMLQLAPELRHPVLGLSVAEIARTHAAENDDVRDWPRPAGWPGSGAVG
jgi:2-amino-4-hydroxy-6-hydroxymethyldihydropteridine diphosphokinase